MSAACPNCPPPWIKLVEAAGDAIRQATEEVGRGRRLVFDEAREASTLALLARGPEGLGLEAILSALPNSALVLVQNIGREAFRELLRRTAVDPEFHRRLADCMAGVDVSQSSIMQRAYEELLERAVRESPRLEEQALKTWPTFTEPGKVLAHYRSVCKQLLLRAWSKKTTRAAREKAAGENKQRNQQVLPADEQAIRQHEAAHDARRIEAGHDALTLTNLEQRVAYILQKYHGWDHASIGQLLWPEASTTDPGTISRRIHRRTSGVQDLIVQAILKLKRNPGPDPPSPPHGTEPEPAR